MSGAGDLVIAGIPSIAGFTAVSAGGDVTLTVDTDSNTVMVKVVKPSQVEPVLIH